MLRATFTPTCVEPGDFSGGDRCSVYLLQVGALIEFLILKGISVCSLAQFWSGYVCRMFFGRGVCM